MISHRVIEIRELVDLMCETCARVNRSQWFAVILRKGQSIKEGGSLPPTIIKVAEYR